MFGPFLSCRFNVFSSFADILTRKRDLVRFSLIDFLVSCDWWCTVALSHGAVGWSAACVPVAFSDHTH